MQHGLTSLLMQTMEDGTVTPMKRRPPTGVISWRGVAHLYQGVLLTRGSAAGAAKARSDTGLAARSVAKSGDMLYDRAMVS